MESIGSQRVLLDSPKVAYERVFAAAYPERVSQLIFLAASPGHRAPKNDLAAVSSGAPADDQGVIRVKRRTRTVSRIAKLNAFPQAPERSGPIWFE